MRTNKLSTASCDPEKAKAKEAKGLEVFMLFLKVTVLQWPFSGPESYASAFTSVFHIYLTTFSILHLKATRHFDTNLYIFSHSYWVWATCGVPQSKSLNFPLPSKFGNLRLSTGASMRTLIESFLLWLPGPKYFQRKRLGN